MLEIKLKKMVFHGIVCLYFEAELDLNLGSCVEASGSMSLFNQLELFNLFNCFIADKLSTLWMICGS